MKTKSRKRNSLGDVQTVQKDLDTLKRLSSKILVNASDEPLKKLDKAIEKKTNYTNASVLSNIEVDVSDMCRKVGSTPQKWLQKRDSLMRSETGTLYWFAESLRKRAKAKAKIALLSV